MPGPAVRTREEMILRPERDRAHGAFDGVGVDVDTAIVDEADERLPSRQGVADGDGERGFARDRREPFLQPRLLRLDDRLGAGQADGFASPYAPCAGRANR